MITPILFSRAVIINNNASKHKPYNNLNNYADTFSFKCNNDGYLSSDLKYQLETLAGAYLNITEMLEQKTRTGIRNVQSETGGFLMEDGLTFKNPDNKTLSFEIRTSKNIGKIIRITVKDKKGNVEKAFVTDGNYRLIKNINKNESYKIPFKPQYYTREEIAKQNINEELQTISDCLDTKLLLLRKALNAHKNQDIKPICGKLPEKTTASLENITNLYEEIDTKLANFTPYRQKALKRDFSDYIPMARHSGYIFKNCTENNLKISCIPIQNKYHNNLLRLLVFDKNDNLKNGYLVKDNNKIAANYNTNYINVIPERLNFMTSDEMQSELRDFNIYISSLESKFVAFKDYISKPFVKQTGLLEENVTETLSEIDRLYNVITEKFSSLSPAQIHKIKKGFEDFEPAAGRRGFTFKNINNECQKIIITPWDSKYNSNLTKITVLNNDNTVDKTFVLKDNNKLVKNYNPDYPQIMPTVLKFYDEEEITEYKLLPYIEVLKTKLTEFNNYVAETITQKNTPKTAQTAEKEDTKTPIKREYKKLVKDCTEEFNSALKNINIEEPNLEQFNKILESIKNRLQEFFNN